MTVKIPPTVWLIDDRAFNCPNMEAVKLCKELEPNLGVDVFSNDLAEFNLMVPSDYLSYYSLYSSIKEYFTSVTSFMASMTLSDAEGYTATGDDWCTSACYDRDVTNNKWQGICLPFSLRVMELIPYCQIAELIGAEDNVLQWRILTARDNTQPGVPYIFLPNEGSRFQFNASNVLVKSCDYLPVVEYNGYRLQGNYVEKTDMAAIKGYALSNGMFFYSTDPNKKLKPFRIFLTVPVASSAPVRMLVDGEEVSSIDDLEIEVAPEGQAYNLMGIPVDDTYKGIVIINGQKIIRK